MKLRNKIHLVIAAIIASVVICAFLLGRTFILSKFSEVESEWMYENVARAHHSVYSEVNKLDSFAQDWGWWNNTYEFMENLNEDYIANNLNIAAMSSIGANYMLFLNTSGKAVHTIGADLENEMLVEVPPELVKRVESETSLFKLSSLKEGVGGLIVTPIGSFLLASRQILTSEANGPSHGTIVMIRKIDPSLVKNLEKLVQLDMDVVAPEDPEAPSLLKTAFENPSDTAPLVYMGDDRMAGFAVLKDLSGEPALAIRVEAPRAVLKYAKTAITYLLLSMVVLGIISFAITSVLLKRDLLAHLARIDNEELKRSEQTTRAVFESALDGIIIADIKSLTFIDANQVACDMLGYTHDEIKELGVNDIHPDIDLPKVRNIFDMQAKGDLTTAKNLPVKKKDGTIFRANINAYPIHVEDDEYIVGVFHDISEELKAEERRKFAERRYSELAASLPVGVYRNTAGSKGRYLEANPAIIAMFEADSREDFLKCNVSDLYQDPQRRRVFSDKMIKFGRVKNEEIELKTLKGRHFWGSVTAVMKTDPNGNIYFDGIIEDITARKEAETALKRVNRELERLNTTKTEFTSMVSHELRTPLGTIKQAIEIILEGVDGPVTEKQTTRLSTAKRNVDRLVRLTNDILDFTRLETGRIEMSFEATDLNNLVEDIFSLMKPAAEKKKIDFHLALPNDAVIAVCDNDKIRQTLINLINNATKFTEEGGKITLALEDTGDDAKISITDSGVGIDASQISKLFEPFSQIKNPLFKASEGSGLGLSICKQIMDAHDGRIDVESQPNAGTVFHVWIPKLGPSAKVHNPEVV